MDDQLASVSALWSSAGNSQTRRPSWSRVSSSGSAPSSSSEQERASRKAPSSKRTHPREFCSSDWQRGDLILQVLLALAGALQLLFCDPLPLLVQVRFLDLLGELVGGRVADAASKESLHIVVDDLRQAAQLPLDPLRLPDQHLENAVLGPLGQDEVVTAHFPSGLKFAVDAAVPLLDPAGVPRKVEVEQVGAVGLEVQTFPRRIRRQQNAKRVLGGLGVEALLDLPPIFRADQPVNHLDALIRQVRSCNRFLQDVPQVALRAFPVLGEDQHPAVVPGGRLTLRQLAEGRKPGAEVFPYPIDQPPHLGVGQVPRLLGDCLHPVQKLLLPAPQLFGPFVSRTPFLGRDRHRLDLGFFFGFQLILFPLAPLVIGIRRRPQQAVLLFGFCNFG